MMASKSIGSIHAKGNEFVQAMNILTALYEKVCKIKCSWTMGNQVSSGYVSIIQNPERTNTRGEVVNLYPMAVLYFANSIGESNDLLKYYREHGAHIEIQELSTDDPNYREGYFLATVAFKNPDDITLILSMIETEKSAVNVMPIFNSALAPGDQVFDLQIQKEAYIKNLKLNVDDQKWNAAGTGMWGKKLPFHIGLLRAALRDISNPDAAIIRVNNVVRELDVENRKDQQGQFYAEIKQQISSFINLVPPRATPAP